MKKEIDIKKKETGVNRYIGQKLYEARIAAGLVREDLALKIDVTPQQLMNYETAKNQISIAKLFLVAEALLLDLNYFLEDIKPTKWDEKTREHQRAALNISNNFMKIKDKACKKAISALLVAIVQLNLNSNTNTTKAQLE